MASIDTGDSGGGKKVRSKKMDTRIDFTPMVDLGFLLITFFMLTTTLSKPNIMPMIFPEKKIDKEDLEPVKESKVLTLLLGADDKVYYYEGITEPTLDSTDFSAEGLRALLLDKKARVSKQFPDVEKVDTLKNGTIRTRIVPEVNVILKPMKDSRYKNVVDAFDEFAITKIAYYVLLDVSDAEVAFVKNPAAGLNFSAEAQSASATQ